VPGVYFVYFRKIDGKRERGGREHRQAPANSPLLLVMSSCAPAHTGLVTPGESSSSEGTPTRRGESIMFRETADGSRSGGRRSLLGAALISLALGSSASAHEIWINKERRRRRMVLQHL